MGRVFRISDVQVSGDDVYGFPVQDAGSRSFHSGAGRCHMNCGVVRRPRAPTAEHSI